MNASSGSGRAQIVLVLKLVVSAVAIIVILAKVDRDSVLAVLRETKIAVFVLSILTVPLLIFLLSVKYWLIVRGREIEKSLSFLIKLNFVCTFYGLFLPAQIGPAAVRWYRVTKNRVDRAYFAGTSFFERVTFVLVLAVSSLVAVYLSDPVSDSEEMRALRRYILWVSVVLSLICVITASYFVNYRIRRTVVAMMVRCSRGVGGRIGRLAEKLSSTLDVELTHAVALKVLGVSVAWQLAYVLLIYLLIKAVGLGMSITDVFWIAPVSLMLHSLPVTFAGIGLREGVFAYLLTVNGYPAEKGLAVGVLLFFHTVITAGIGWILHMVETDSPTPKTTAAHQ